MSPSLMLAAEMLLQNATLDQDFTSTDVGDKTPGNAFQTLQTQQLLAVRVELEHYVAEHFELPTSDAGLGVVLAVADIDFAALRDPWGRRYHLVATPRSYGLTNLVLRSDGADKTPGTHDDFDFQIATWQWFRRHQIELQHATDTYHERTGRFIRSLVDLHDEMAQEGIAFDEWRDPWGHPFTYRFNVEGSFFNVQAFSQGAPGLKPSDESYYGDGPYFIGAARIDYFVEQRARVETALNSYTDSHPFPVNNTQLQAALLAAGAAFSSIRDPWGRSLYATFSSRSFFTDRVQTEAHATPGSATQVRTTLTPVTAVADTLSLYSAGNDGRRGTVDDFSLAAYSRTRTLQSAHEAAPRVPANRTVRSARTGGVAGTITDPTGAIISGVTVLARNLATLKEYEAKTDARGAYLLEPLPAGRYQIRITEPGFQNFIYDGFVVLPRVVGALDAKLDVGTVSEAVQVNAASATLDTMSASIATTRVSNLPIDGNNVVALAALKPGLMAPPPPPSGAESTSTPRLRDYFPETLLWRPEIITAPDGTATVHFRVADNITTWQLSAAASTQAGNTGAGGTEFRTFQPFFAAFDPPRVLTIGDTVALPITLRNYLDHSLSVRSELSSAPWFRLEGPPATITPVPKQDSASPVFRFTATAPVVDAQQQFTAVAADANDAVARTVTVHPDGLESAVTNASVISPGSTEFTLRIPADALAHGNDASLKLYPNLAAHLRDALVAMARYPSGCAEQITSTAWPSLLLQRYAARLPHADETLQQQTHHYLEEAYANLLADQLPDGGFAYWRDDRTSDLALTAYVLQFLRQAREFVTVDEHVTGRALDYLAKQQQPKESKQAGMWVRISRDGKPLVDDRAGNAMLTASIAAMLSSSPGNQEMIARALKATQPFVEEFDEPYALANYTLAAIAVKDTARAKPSLTRLRALALSENGGAYWKLETNTPFFGWGRAGRVESTSQVLRALLAGGATPQDDLVTRGMLFLDHEQDRHNAWYSTQATARVLDVLAAVELRSPAAPKGTAPGALAISIDGVAASAVPLPPAESDSGPLYVPLGAALPAGDHHITLTLPSSASPATAQIVANFYRPWPRSAPRFTVANNEQLRLGVRFSTTHPTPGTPVTATAHIERLGFRGYGMMIAEVGLPPGADVDRASLEEAMTTSGYQLNHYEILPDKLLVYVWPRAGGLDLRFKFNLRFAVRALTAPSDVYDFYNPDARFDLAPALFTSPRLLAVTK